MRSLRCGVGAVALVAMTAVGACAADSDGESTQRPVETAPDLGSGARDTSDRADADPPAPATTATTASASVTTTSIPDPGPLPAATVGEAVAVADEPVDLAVRSGDDALYVAERRGTVRRLDPPDATPLGDVDGAGAIVLDMSADLVPEVEEGLLGMTFSPDGSWLYLNSASEGRTSVTVHAVDADGGIDAAPGREVIGYDQPFEAHNGGALAFGPDGFLYVFSGDGGFVADPDRRGLDLATPLAKILRIDPTPEGAESYRIPPDNPYVGVDDALDEIWSIGLRNPWRASFDAHTGDLWIGDVGDFALEEINVAWADEGGGRGTSFGWSAYEGTERFNADQPADGHEAPFFEYPHGDDGCSVSAGERYRGSEVPDLHGWYVFSDFCSGLVRALEVTPEREPGRLVDLGVVPYSVTVRAGPDGELYVVSIEGGIHPIVAT